MRQTMKECARCGVVKQDTEFHKNSRNSDGLHSYCKLCNAEKAALHLKTEKGKVSLKNAVKRQSEKGYYRYGKGAYYILKQGAEKRNIGFQITPDQLSQWWKGNLDQCYYCGITEEE